MQISDKYNATAHYLVRTALNTPGSKKLFLACHREKSIEFCSLITDITKLK